MSQETGNDSQLKGALKAILVVGGIQLLLMITKRYLMVYSENLLPRILTLEFNSKVNLIVSLIFAAIVWQISDWTGREKSSQGYVWILGVLVFISLIWNLFF